MQLCDDDSLPGRFGPWVIISKIVFSRLCFSMLLKQKPLPQENFMITIIPPCLLFCIACVSTSFQCYLSHYVLCMLR